MTPAGRRRVGQARRLARTMAGYFLVPVLSAIAPLMAIPALLTAGGTQGWAAVAVAQGIGMTAALVVTYGWGAVGPTEVARASPADQQHIYWESVVMRLLLACLVVPISVVLTAVVVQERHLVLATLVCIAFTLQGMGPTWFFVGQGRPFVLAAAVTLPRTAGVLAASALVVHTGDLIGYPIILLAVEVLIAVSAFLRHGRRPTASGPLVRMVWRRITQQWPLALSGLTSSVYMRAAVPIVSAVDYRAVPSFAAMDRLQGFSRTGIRPFVYSFQGWVSRGKERSTARALVATAATVCAGAAGGIVLLLAVPWLDTFLFAGLIQVTRVQAALVCAGLIAVSASYSTGYYFLVPRGAYRALSSSSVAGAAVGLPLLVVGVHLFGSTGAVLAIASAEWAIVAWQVAFLLVDRRRRDHPGGRPRHAAAPAPTEPADRFVAA